jgi:hypothetical protein
LHNDNVDALLLSQGWRISPHAYYSSSVKMRTLHVAVAVCHRLDMIVSWNMKHLANPNKVALINAVNRQHGRPLMRIHTPQEVIGL